jgi:hypothetical protein
MHWQATAAHCCCLRATVDTVTVYTRLIKSASFSRKYAYHAQSSRCTCTSDTAVLSLLVNLCQVSVSLLQTLAQRERVLQCAKQWQGTS